MSADQPTSEPVPAESPDPDETPAEATKRKFREALEAKKNRRGEDHIDDGQQHVHAHGPVDSKRVFRRKTG